LNFTFFEHWRWGRTPVIKEFDVSMNFLDTAWVLKPLEPGFIIRGEPQIEPSGTIIVHKNPGFNQT
jgi:hypothetical protein